MPVLARTTTAAVTVRLASALVLAGCSDPSDGSTTEVTGTSGAKARINLTADQRRVTTAKVDGPEDVAGLTVAVSSGTNQEKLLVEWSKQNEEAGRKPVDIKYYQNDGATCLALRSGRIDLCLGPNPTAAYHAATGRRTEVVGTYSGAGDTLQGLVAATTKKDSGLVEPLADALNGVIRDGTHGKALARWGLSDEAVEKSEINPPGLPRTDQ